jgi:hypothetical protein
MWIEIKQNVNYQKRRIDYEIFSFFYSVSNDDHSIKFC